MTQNIPFPYVAEDNVETITARAREVQTANRAVFQPVAIVRSQIVSRWSEIESHKWFLSERLGRNVGSLVAGLDYLENIARLPERKTQASLPARVASAAKSSLTAFERLLDSEGFHAFGNMQQIMRGVPVSRQLTAHHADKSGSILAADIRDVRIPATLIAESRQSIQEHKWILSERLGRDVGTKVATLDYFENIQPDKAESSLRKKLLRVLDRLTEGGGPNSIANLERAVARTRTRP